MAKDKDEEVTTEAPQTGSTVPSPGEEEARQAAEEPAKKD